MFCDVGVKTGQIEIRYRTGDVAVFDTNGLHRGAYELSKSKRCVFVMEFIDRNKANSVSGLVPCGPGACPAGSVTFHRAGFASLAQTELIDAVLVKEMPGDFVRYSMT